jgi:hypothetical protein
MMDYRRHAQYEAIKSRAQERAKASQNTKQKEQQSIEAAKLYMDGKAYNYFKNMFPDLFAQ